MDFMSCDTLTLFRLRFFGRHGVLSEETARGQDFEVTIRLELPLRAAGVTDDLNQTVDYRAVHALVRGIMEGPRRKLVEALAETLADGLLQAFSRIQAVDVEVVKIQPPVDFPSGGLGVRIRRTRPSE